MSKGSRRKAVRRSVLVEQMEARIALAADVGHNFLMPGDVNNDQAVKASDALAIINILANSNSRSAPEGEAVDASVRDMFADVNADGLVSANDALRVINEVAAEGEGSEASEFIEGETGARARIELERKGDGRAELEVRVADAPLNAALDIVIGGEILGQIQTNDLGQGKVEIKYGGAGPELPTVLADATPDTTVAIGDVITGTLGNLGEIESSDGGSDGVPDAASDAASDANSDALSDASSDATTAPASPGIAALISAVSLSDDPSSSPLDDGQTDGGVDGTFDGNSDAASDANSDASSDANSDGGSD